VPGLSDQELLALRRAIHRFVEERDWSQFHDPKNLAMALASEAGELLAEYRWVKSDAADAHSHEPVARARIANEAADVAITLIMFADRIGLDLFQAMRDKLALNEKRYPVDRSRGRADRPEPAAAQDDPKTPK
jgi:NTP pyrophosphatase (non-canonical NTP hydrolase)